jgi:hypothetical protein
MTRVALPMNVEVKDQHALVTVAAPSSPTAASAGKPEAVMSPRVA